MKKITIGKNTKKAVIGAGLVLVLSAWLVLVNAFFNRFYFEFQSPITLQSPILVRERSRKRSEVTEAEAKASGEIELQEENSGESPGKPSSWIYTPKDEKDLTITNREIAQADNKWILWSIYRLESSRGKNDNCKVTGKFNGFGFGQSKHAWNCFDSFREVVIRVDEWFDQRKAEGYTLDEAVCYYNTGIKQDECEYLSNFRSI